MAISIGELEATLRLRDELSSSLKVAMRNIQESGQKLKELSDKIQNVGTSMLPLSAAITAAGAAAFKFSSSFDSAMTKVQTLAGVSADRVARMREEVLALAPATGVGPKELADGLLVVTSTGLRGAEAMEILTAAANASSAGLGATNDIARTLTSAMTAYGKENLSAADAADKLFVAVREGGAEATEFAGSIGRVVGIAQQLGVSFDEVVAQIATFTRLGVNADEAVTALRGTMSSLLNPSKEGREQLELLGTSIEQLRKNVQDNGLTDAMIELVKATKGNFDAIGAIIPNVRAMAGILGTAGSQATQYKDVLGLVKNGHGELNKAVAVSAQTLETKWNKVIADAKVLIIEFGESLKPVFDGLIKNASSALTIMRDLGAAFKVLPESLQKIAIAGAGAFAVGSPLMLGLATLLSSLASLKLLLAGSALGLGAALGGAAAAGAGLGALGFVILNFMKNVREMETRVPSAGKQLKFLADEAKNVSPEIERCIKSFQKLNEVLPPSGAQLGKIVLALDPMGKKAQEAGEAVTTMSVDMHKALQKIALAQKPLNESQAKMINQWEDVNRRAGETVISYEDMAVAIKSTEGAVKNFIEAQKNSQDREWNNWFAETQMNVEATEAALRELFATLEQFPNTDAVKNLFSRDIPQAMMGLAEGKPFKTWTFEPQRKGLTELSKSMGLVEDVLNNISGKWAEMGTVAARVIQNIIMLMLSVKATTGDYVALIISGIVAIAGLFGKGRDVAEENRQQARNARNEFVSMFDSIMDMEKAFREAFGANADYMLGLLRTADTIEEVQGVIESYNEALADAAEAADKFAEETKIVQDAMEALNRRVKAGITTQESFNAVALSALAVWREYVRRTGDVLGAFDQMGESLDALVAAQGQFGFAANRAIQDLLGLHQVVKVNKDIFEAMQANVQIMQALNEVSLMTQEIFDAFGADTVNQFNTLINRGVSVKNALVLMQPALQALWEAQQKFGFAVDSSTQALIDQAVAAGIVGANQMSWQERLINVIGELRDMLRDAFVNAGLLEGKLKDVSMITYPNAPQVPAIQTTSIPTSNDVQNIRSFASGSHGFQNFGSGTMAMLHGWEAVVPIGDAENVASSQGRGGADMSAAMSRLGDELRQIPRAITRAVRDGIAQSGT